MRWAAFRLVKDRFLKYVLLRGNQSPENIELKNEDIRIEESLSDYLGGAGGIGCKCRVGGFNGRKMD